MSNLFNRLVLWLANWFGIGEHESDTSEKFDVLFAGLLGAAVGLNVSKLISVWTSTGRMDYETFMLVLELGGVVTWLLVLAALVAKIWSLNTRTSEPD